MKDLCVPIPGFGDSEHAELTLNLGDKQQTINYRVESFPWDSDLDLFPHGDDVSISLARIERLKKAIQNYDKEWELIQIFTPSANAKNIQVLYRKKKLN